MTIPNLKIIGIEKAKESQLSGIDLIFNRIIEKKKYPTLKKYTHTDTRSTGNTKKTGPEKKVPWHIIVKTPRYTEWRKGTKSWKRKQVAYKGKLIRITASIFMKLESQKSLNQSMDS